MGRVKKIPYDAGFNSGFTLIELAIVITIIGILSAVALSKYINIQSQARTAKAQALYGAIRTASDLAKAACVMDIANVSLNPTCTTTGGTADMDGTAVSMVNEYPDASLIGIVGATQTNPATDGVIITAGNPLTIDITGGTVPNCRISYTAAIAGSRPTITLTTTGC
jgi:MSHA pilin protein MshA